MVGLGFFRIITIFIFFVKNATSATWALLLTGWVNCLFDRARRFQRWRLCLMIYNSWLRILTYVVDSRTHPDWHFPDGYFPDRQFPDGHIPDSLFPDQTNTRLTFPQRAYPRQTLPLTDTSPNGHFPPCGQFPDKQLEKKEQKEPLS